MSVCEVVAIEKKVEGGAIGLTFNWKLTIRICGSNLNSSPVTSPIGYVHIALFPLLKKVMSSTGDAVVVFSNQVTMNICFLDPLIV